MSIQSITQHPDYTLMYEEVEKVELCLEGSPAVKRAGTKLLPHPNQIDQTSPEAQEAYKAYKMGAEFDEIPSETLQSHLGKLKVDDTLFEVPSQLEYLINNCDGDGLSLVGMISEIAKGVIPYNFDFLVTDYRGLSNVDASQVTIADVERMNPRPTIKRYNRKALVDWDFETVNGKLQFSYMLFRQDTYEVTFSESGLPSRSEVESYLMLALDDAGNYYQRKIVYGGKSDGYVPQEKNEVRISGQPLKFIPVEVVASSELQSGELPRAMGMLGKICDLSLKRYKINADLNAYLDKCRTTLFISGGTDQDFQSFEKVNGRKYIAQGGVNWLPSTGDNPIEVKYDGANPDVNQVFQSNLDLNEKKIRAQGGVFPSNEQKQRTATEVIHEAEENAARFTPMVNSIEEGIKRSILYCGMYQGLYSQDDIENNLDQITVNMPRNFATQKLTPDERKAFRDDYLAGIISIDAVVDAYIAGGIWPKGTDKQQAIAMLGVD